MLQIFNVVYRVFNVIVIIILLGIHFVVKDNAFQGSVLFYSFPLPLIIIVVLFLSILLGKKRKYNVILATILSVVWLVRSFNINLSQVPKTDTLEIVYWNASREHGFDAGITLNGQIPDLMVLSETKRTHLDSLRAKYPTYYFYSTAVGLELFSKKPLILMSEQYSRFHSALVHFKMDNLNFYAVDLQGSTDVPRSWEMTFLNSHIESTKNTIVLGDFNLPYESVLYKDLKKNFYDALTKKGTGFRETWFWAIPLLSLDHIWVSKDIETYKAQKMNTLKSDHSMIKAFVKTD